MWYEPKPEYLFQDSAGTTPVTADGQPVGYMEDLSGNGNHATQDTAAAKPLYRTDGTLHWLEGDGVDDYMFHGLGLAGSLASIVAAELLSNSDNPQGMLLVTAPNDPLSGGIWVETLGSNAWGTYTSGWKSSGVPLLNNPSIIEVINNNETQEKRLYTNGVLNGVFTGEYAGDADDRRVLFSEQVPGGTAQRPAHARFFGALTTDYIAQPDQQASARQYLASLSGVTL